MTGALRAVKRSSERADRNRRTADVGIRAVPYILASGVTLVAVGAGMVVMETLEKRAAAKQIPAAKQAAAGFLSDAHKKRLACPVDLVASVPKTTKSFFAFALTNVNSSCILTHCGLPSFSVQSRIACSCLSWISNEGTL
jgi:hypothetical protein